MSEDALPGPIAYEDFQKVDIRAGTILTAEPVPKSTKLVKLTVDVGPELGVRTIVAGIAPSYPVADLPGFHCLVVVNLAPRKLMGIESHGMLLAAERTLPAIPTCMVALARCLGASPGARIG